MLRKKAAKKNQPFDEDLVLEDVCPICDYEPGQEKKHMVGKHFKEAGNELYDVLVLPVS
jgi:hypothetical protein